MTQEQSKQTLADALAVYIAVLARSADQTHYAEDRSRYEKHMAAAARMFSAMHLDSSRQELKRIVKEERHSYGWSFLSGTEGADAESAFTVFAAKVEEVPSSS
jgi:hypothetical protein